MPRLVFGACTALAALVLISGCAQQAGDDLHANGNGHKVTTIQNGPEARVEAQEALINAEAGEIIEFAEGEFELDMTLSLEDLAGITIRGQGMDKTILNFASQAAGAGGEGIKVGAGCDDFTIENLTVRDSKADAIKVQGVKGVTFRRVLVEWTRGPDPDNGAYGVYPVLCENVLIEDCVVTDCSDAGVYVGQSKNVIVRRNRAERNVVGIEIENTIGADVYNNVSTNNAGGLAVFALPGLEQKVGRQCRMFNNEVYANNHVNFAKEGNIVASVPSGTGLMIMANEEVEAFNNEIRDNRTANVLIISYLSTQREYDDPQYDPFPTAIHIHDNEISGGGQDPQGDFGALLRSAIGTPAPDIIYDGVLPQDDRVVDGELVAEKSVVIKNNGDATFINLDMTRVMSNEEPQMNRDLAAHDGTLEPLEPISIPGS